MERNRSGLSNLASKKLNRYIYYRPNKMVEKDRFNYLVSNYNSLSQKETAELRLEQDRYGYCQVLHQLIARGDQDNQTEMKEQSLHIAAVYSTDRSVLKQVMTEPRMERVELPPPLQEQKKEQKDISSEIAAHLPVVEEIKETPTSGVQTPIEIIEQKEDVVVPKSDPDFDVDEVLSKFMADLKPMHEKKLQFEKAVEEFEKKLNEKTPDNLETEAKPKRRGRPKKQTSKSTENTKEESANTSEKLLDEIKTSKKKVIPESQKHKEQSEIIDQFIKTKPSISKPTGSQQEIDLTGLTESYNENVVSETLALILIKQGKKEKAVEVLRKLIWKFPQKKAYFAAQIEELTK